MKLIIHSIELSDDESKALQALLDDIRVCDKASLNGCLSRAFRAVKDIQSAAFIEGVALGKSSPNITIAAAT